MIDPETVSPPGKTEAADGFPLCSPFFSVFSVVMICS